MQLMMFREFEICLWNSFCQADALKMAVTGDNLEADKKAIVNHLMNTAFFTKKLVVSDEEFLKFQAFFDKNFAVFQGKHTDWLLLNEPDPSGITPQKISLVF
jgi:hypothetical protein